ncbi:MAG TPA: SIR2 family protein [Candidatus Angelobacter sp.]|jgi:hypothetical protein
MPRQTISNDPRSGYIKRLHRAYSQGRLNIFIGAGISQGSGFDGWDAFNKKLIRRYLETAIGNSTPAAMLASTNIESTAEALYEILGRDAAADFVSRATSRHFAHLLADTLYNKRRIEDLPLKSSHRQLAALAERARLFTTNFDPLLELALAQKLQTREWKGFRSPNEKGEVLKKKNKVEHLHGWIDPDGRISSNIILTESDYLELTANSVAHANRFLKKMLASNDTTLIAGMSLADPNFRRVLYFLNKSQLSSRERIYVITRRDRPAIDHYAEVHWVRRGLRLLFVKHHDDAPGLLRDVQWGESSAKELPKWISPAIEWREKNLPTFAVFSDAWQRIAYDSLNALTEEIRNLFAVPDNEKISAGLFLPFWDSRSTAMLRLVASSRKFVDGKKAIFRATRRALSIKKGEEQGIAGVCYATGTNRSVEFGSGQVDINFTPEMVQNWMSQVGYRDWRSIVAVPVIDTKYWIPVAVITLTSNMPSPFWSNFESKAYLLEPELYTVMRRTAHFCMVDFASNGK